MDKMQRIEHWQIIVDGVVADYRRLNAACEAASKSGTLDLNGRLYEEIWRAYGNMLKRIDLDGLIDWFVFENECGSKGLEANALSAGKMTPIKTTRQLARILAAKEELLGTD